MEGITSDMERESLPLTQQKCNRSLETIMHNHIHAHRFHHLE
jgi:hypothetical protein